MDSSNRFHSVKVLKMKSYLDQTFLFRETSLEETLNRIEPLLKTIGVTRVANLSNLDHSGLFMVSCIRPNSKNLSVAQGKGLTLLQAKVSAMMEMMEAYHLENPPSSVLKGSYTHLSQKYPVIPPKLFQQGIFTLLALEDYSLTWIKAKELITNQDCFLPSVLTSIDTTDHEEAYLFFEVSSNGIAAGNTETEALNHALMEVIERDSLTKWQKISERARKKTQICLSSIDSPVVRLLLGQLKKSHLLVKAWAIHSELGMPAFHCVIGDPNLVRGLSYFTGTGAHVNKALALCSAITEAMQSRLTLITGTRDDVFPSFYQRRVSSDKKELLRLFPEGEKDYQNCPNVLVNDIIELNQFLLNSLKKEGYQKVFCVNHIKLFLKIPVMQVFIPGLEFNSERMS